MAKRNLTKRRSTSERVLAILTFSATLLELYGPPETTFLAATLMLVVEWLKLRD